MHAKKKRVKKKTLNSASILSVIICECRPKKRIAVTLLYYVRSRLSRVSFVDSTTQQQPDHITRNENKNSCSIICHEHNYVLAGLSGKDEGWAWRGSYDRYSFNCWRQLFLCYHIEMTVASIQNSFLILSVSRKLLARSGLKPLWKNGKTAALTKALHLDAMGNALTHTGISYSIYIQHTHTHDNIVLSSRLRKVNEFCSFTLFPFTPKMLSFEATCSL